MLTYDNSLTKEDIDDGYRMYVLVRRDILPLVHCAVQASHAVAEYVYYHQNPNTRVWVTAEKTLIILEATEKQIEEKMKLFAEKHMNYQPFWEPDMSNAMTAVAFQPIKTSLGREIFKDFKLLK
jgi:hypothetical protein